MSRLGRGTSWRIKMVPSDGSQVRYKAHVGPAQATLTYHRGTLNLHVQNSTTALVDLRNEWARVHQGAP